MNSSKKTPRIVGVLILLAYALLGSNNPEQKVMGMFLEAISGFAVITIAILLFPLFKPHNNKASFWYLISRFIEGGLMVIAGILFLANSPQLLGIRDTIYLGHGYIFSVAALIFYYLFYISKLIPRFISIWGIVASILLILVMLLQVTKIIPESMIFYLPIISNEVFLAIWLIVKGFSSVANAPKSKNE